MTIGGKVAKILNGRELIINRGSEAGVEPEMKFKVLEERVEITDPDTGNNLGTLEREKIRIRITEVQPKFAIGRTYETYQTSAGIFDSSVFSTLTLPRRVTKVRTLKTQGDPIANSDENVATVSTGDPVLQIEGESDSVTVED